MGFKLHPQLEKDTHFLCDLPACRALLMNDARYLWVILVPRIENAIEWHDLPEIAQNAAFAETMKVSSKIKQYGNFDKINIGALGNMVPQLHVHIIGRKIGDFAWPAPVWGKGEAIAYDKAIIEEIKNALFLDA